jgi:hypothetical protein
MELFRFILFTIATIWAIILLGASPYWFIIAIMLWISIVG